MQIAEPLKIPEASAKNICDLAKSRLRAVANYLDGIKPKPDESASGLDDSKDVTGNGVEDRGFSVFKLASSNIKTWEQDPADLEQALLSHLDHVKEGRTEQDILYELLLKRGVDLCASIELQELVGKQVSAVDDGTLIACLAEAITSDEVEELASGIVDWRDEMDNTDDTTVIFRDSAFTDDVAKTNCIEILRQRGIRNVRSI